MAKRAVRGLVVGISTGLLLTPFAAMGYELAIFVIAIALALALGSGFISGLGTTSEERLTVGQDAGRVIHDDLMTGVMVGFVWLAVCLSIGPLLGVARWLQIASKPMLVVAPEPNGNGSYYTANALELSPLAAVKEWPAWVLPGLVLGLSAGLVLAILIAPLAAGASGRYAVASLLFGFTGIFPRRPARFLEWARDSGLLRVTGVAYQFRHDTYQQWLAAGDVERRVKTTLDAKPTDDLIEQARLFLPPHDRATHVCHRATFVIAWLVAEQ